MKKKFLILLILLVVVAGGFFYFWYVWIPAQMEKESGVSPETQPPTLFGKEDYKIEEREDGKYIVVEKVGLTAKVPEGWEIKFEGSDYPEPEYWVNLSSPDAEVKDIPIKGCGISIIIGNEKETVKDIRNNIEILEEHPDIKPEEISYIYKDYTFDLIEINGYQTLLWKAPEREITGQAAGINILIGDEKLISFNTRFLPDYKQKCSPIWEKFLNDVVIE